MRFRYPLLEMDVHSGGKTSNRCLKFVVGSGSDMDLALAEQIIKTRQSTFRVEVPDSDLIVHARISIEQGIYGKIVVAQVDGYAALQKPENIGKIIHAAEDVWLKGIGDLTAFRFNMQTLKRYEDLKAN